MFTWIFTVIGKGSQEAITVLRAKVNCTTKSHIELLGAHNDFFQKTDNLNNLILCTDHINYNVVLLPISYVLQNSRMIYPPPLLNVTWQKKKKKKKGKAWVLRVFVCAV